MGMYQLKPSFAGGELTPALYGRTDLQKYDVGAAVLQNAVVLRYGGVTRRPGFRYITGTKSNRKARLIPFSYNTEQNYVLEFTAGKVRFFTQGGIITSGGSPVEVSTPYTEAELPKIKYTQSADVLFLVHPNHPPATLTRYSNTSWTYAVMNITNGPFDDPNTTDITITPSATTGNITLTASDDYFTAAMEGQRIHIGHTVPNQYRKGKPNQNASGSTVTSPTFSGTIEGYFTGSINGSYNKTITHYDEETGEETTETVRENISTSVSNASIGGAFNGKAGTSISGSFSGYVGSSYPGFSGTISGTFSGTMNGTYSQASSIVEGLSVSCVPGGTVYVESFGFWDGSFVVEKQDDTGAWNQLKRQSGNRSQNYNMTFTNDDDVIRFYRVTSTEFNTAVREGEDANQRGYVTIQSFAKDYYGIARIDTVTDATTAEATVIKTLGAATATKDFALQAWSNTAGYPQAIGFFEDRLVFAGSKAQPQTYWASKSGDYYNFGQSVPLADDDAITGTLASGQMNGIKAIVSFGEIVMLTSGGEYRVSGGGENFTPTNQQARAQEYRGINDLTPVVIGGRIVYVQQHGGIVRDLAYSYDVDKYTGDDVSILAAHLFDGHSIVGMTYQQIPDSVVWCVREDGVLLGMTYVKEQDVYAWHRHTTQGQFIDVCSIGGTNEDELWAVIKRGNNYCVEQMSARFISDDTADQFYVDSGFSYSGSAVSTIPGLTWLAGKTVQVLADGHKLADTTVANNGTLTLDHAYSKISVGLEYDTVIQTLPVEMSGQDGTWGSRKKRIQNMMVMFKETVGGKFGFADNAMDEIKWRSTEAWGTPVALYNGKKKITLPQANYEDTLMLTIKQDAPFPMTVLSIIPEVLPGG